MWDHTYLQGIALDEPVGKNNGMIKGTRYFSCERKCGVLVKPKKASRLHDKYDVAVTRSGDGYGITIANPGKGNFISHIDSDGVMAMALKTLGARQNTDDGMQIMRTVYPAPANALHCTGGVWSSVGNAFVCAV